MAIHHTSDNILSAVYEDLAQSRRAVQGLRRLGVPDSALSIVTSGEHYPINAYHDIDQAQEEVQGVADEGLESGAALGGLGGFLLGLAVVSVPGVGPVLAIGGILSATLTGAAVGGLAGGLIASLAEMGIPEDHAEAYQSSIQAGRGLVVAKVPADKLAQAQEVLLAQGPLSVRDFHQMPTG